MEPSILKSRRFWLGLVAIASLSALGLVKGADVAWPIASIAMGTSIANAYQKKAQPEGAAKNGPK